MIGTREYSAVEFVVDIIPSIVDCIWLPCPHPHPLLHSPPPLLLDCIDIEEANQQDRAIFCHFNTLIRVPHPLFDLIKNEGLSSSSPWCITAIKSEQSPIIFWSQSLSVTLKRNNVGLPTFKLRPRINCYSSDGVDYTALKTVYIIANAPSPVSTTTLSFQ